MPTLIQTEPTASLDRLSAWWRVSDSDRAASAAKTVFVLCACFYFTWIARAESGPINQFGNDAFILLDGGWRIFSGQVPYRDFYLALGPLEYMITAAGMALTHGSPHAIALGTAIFGAVVALWGWLIAKTRMAVVPALVVTAWLILTATSPTPIGSASYYVSCAMIYNRHGYVLLGILLIECVFLGKRSSLAGGLSSGIVCGLLAFLKLNFFGAAVCILLVTLPLRRAERSRAVGVLLGFGLSVLVFDVFLRFHMAAFIADMLVATQGRASSLSHIVQGFAINGGELVTLAIITLVAALLIAQDTLWKLDIIRTLLLGIAVLLTGVLLQETNAGETSLELGTLWIVLLLAQLTTVYAVSGHKTAVSAILALGAGLAAPQFVLDGVSLLRLLQYDLTSLKSTGATIAAAPGMQSLRFYDYLEPDAVAGYDNGHIYVGYLDDGVALLQRSSSPSESVLALGYHNPFAYLLRRKPALGGSPWLHIGNNLSKSHPLPAERIFGDAALIMVPTYFSCHLEGDGELKQEYSSYLQQHFTQVGTSRSWILYRRHP